MVVADGVTVTGVPLVTAPTPLLMLPVPLTKTGVSVVECPAVIVAEPDTKLETAGAGNTVTVKPLLVALIPCASVTFTVRVWFTPAVVGVPCTVTVLVVLLLRDKPAGPAMSDHVNGLTPPVIVTVLLYAVPTLPDGMVVVVICGDGCSVIVKLAVLV